MAYSIGLTLYNLSNRRDFGSVAERPARPAGALVWLHAPGAEAVVVIVQEPGPASVLAAARLE